MTLSTSPFVALSSRPRYRHSLYCKACTHWTYWTGTPTKFLCHECGKQYDQSETQEAIADATA